MFDETIRLNAKHDELYHRLIFIDVALSIYSPNFEKPNYSNIESNNAIIFRMTILNSGDM